MKEIIINDNASKQIKNLIRDIHYKWRYPFLGEMGSVHGYQSNYISIYYSFRNRKNPILTELNIIKGGSRKRRKSRSRSKSKRTKSRSRNKSKSRK